MYNDVWGCAEILPYVLLSVTDNFGLGELAKIERNDGKLLRRSIEEYSRVDSESVKQYANIVWLLLYLLLKLPGMTACPIVFLKRFNLLSLA